MVTISTQDLNLFLLTEACAHTRTWLRALRSSPARTTLLRLLAEGEAIIPWINTDMDIAFEARVLLQSIQINSTTASPSELWPKEFAKNPWTYADEWPRMQKEQVALRWARWKLRESSFRVLTSRVCSILMAIEHFDDPRTDTSWRTSGRIAQGYKARYALATQIVVPDIRWSTTVSTQRAAGKKLQGYEINDLAIRQATPVTWLHIENDEGSFYDDAALARIHTIAWERGMRGIYFASSTNKRGAEVELSKPASDMRLQCGSSDDRWQPEQHQIPFP